MSECKYTPLFGRVIIKREPPMTSKGGILIPENVQQRHAKSNGVVVAIGEKAEGVKVGDKVIFGRHSGTWLDSTYADKTEKDDGTLFMCQDEDILAVVNE